MVPPGPSSAGDPLGPADADRETEEIVASFLQRSHTILGREIEDLCAAHPERAEALRQRLRSLKEYGFLASSKGEGEQVPRVTSEAQHVAHYRILRELGRGGQGVVYLAEDTHLHRKVALKVLSELGALPDDVLRRFRREAEVASKLDHPGICTVFDSGIFETTPYIVFRYVNGQSLSSRIRSAREDDATPSTCIDLEDSSAATLTDEPSGEARTPSTRAEVMREVEVVEKAARALHAAHEAGVIHRDIKPGNIMVTAQGEPVLLDFGLARDLEGDQATLTRSGALFGTLAYMSPEQLTRQSIRLDPRTDVYSLGVVLYECLTLRRPFEAPTVEALYQAILAKDPPDPRRLNPNLPDDLRVVLETALEKDRDRRYQSAHDLAEDLRRVRTHEPIAAKPASAWVKLKRWAQRNPALAGSLSAGFLFLSVGLAAALILLGQREEALNAKETALDRYAQMSDAAQVEGLKAQATKLWPRRPHMVPAMSKWLEKAREVYTRLPIHEAALEELRERAAPYDDAQLEVDGERHRRNYPGLFDAIAAKRREIIAVQKRLAWLRKRAPEVERSVEDTFGTRTRAEGEDVGPVVWHFGELEKLEAELPRLIEELAALEGDPRLSKRQTWKIDDPVDHWRHQILSQIVEELGAFGTLLTDVQSRQAFAATIEKRSIEDHRAAWDRCLADIALNPRYADANELMDVEPVVGLVPLGIDGDSGFWEFWHVDSGARPGWEGPDWVSARPADPRGRVKINASSGIVMVFLPAGTFWMGATAADVGQNHDPQAESKERPVHQVALNAFLMSKYELTQAQWERLTGDDPSTYRVGTTNFMGGTVTALHPVTDVDWRQCRDAMRRWDLDLPTEAQWEYACRGGTGTVYWCGDSAVLIGERRAGNISDRTASKHTPWVSTREVDDGFVVHAPVGSFAANAFGLHDVLGNVWEWCTDRWASYDRPTRPGDGLRGDPGSRYRVHRGGSFNEPAVSGRSGLRSRDAPSYRGYHLGLRPARGITTP